MRLVKSFLVGTALVALLPAAAHAQGTITGLVTDNTGGGLPGVTVEAASPVMIEGSRIAISDGTGRYTIVGLDPGIYSVTMTLPGFSTFVQEGLELQAQFTLTVNGALSVGALEETVTVTGETPIVDVQSAARTEVIQRDTLDSLPTPRNTQSIGYLAQGVRLTRPDVGGAQMMEQVRMSAHGANARHTTMQVDGMMVNSQMADGLIMNYNNQALSQEMAISTSGSPAEVSAGGLRLNMIPKDGGNQISGTTYVGFTLNRSWQADNFTQGLSDLGLESNQGISNIHDINPAIGGPLLQDKLWYFTSFRGISVDEIYPGGFVPNFRSGVTDPEIDDYFLNFSKDHPAVESVEDAVSNQYVYSGLLRLTSQVTPRNKVSAYLDRIFKHKDREFVAGTEPIRSGSHRDPGHANYHTFQAKWTSTISSRALLEVGYSQVYERLLVESQPLHLLQQVDPNATELRHPAPNDLQICIATPCYHPASYNQTGPWFADTRVYDVGRSTTTNNYWGDVWVTPSDRRYPNAAFSYVTGSHNFKVGMQWSVGNDGDTRDRNAHAMPRYREGVPESVLVFNTPTSWNTFVRADRGIYMQDTWTRDRLTINAGLRIEHFESQSNTFRTGPSLPSGRFIDARLSPAFDQGPFWTDYAPRLSVVYDLFGDARTALKFSANKFMRPYASGHAERYSPYGERNESRDWNDCALNPAIHATSTFECATPGQLMNLPASPEFYLSTNGDGIVQDHEIGEVGNTAIFSSGSLPSAGSRPADDLEREYNWEYSASIQHELAPRISLTAAYYRRVFSHIEQRANLALATCDPSSISAASLTPGVYGAPCGDWLPFLVDFDDPTGRLSYLGGIGQGVDMFPGQLIAFNRLTNAQYLDKYGFPYTTDNVDTTSDINRNYYNGFEVSVQARLPNGGALFGGWTAHQHVQDTCGLTSNPNGVFQEDLIRDDEDILRGGQFCNQSELGMPFRNDFKLFGAYPLPGDFELSGSIQAYSGAERELRWTIPSGYYPDGQRTGGYAIQLFAPGTNYFDYWTQVDIAIRKVLRFGNYETSVQADIYNLMNASAIVDENDGYGSGYARPSRLLQGRLLRLALQLKW